MKVTASWKNEMFWHCHRHIPTSMVIPWFTEQCPACKNNRPDRIETPKEVNTVH